MPEDRRNFDLGDYVEVKDRIKTFYELYGQGRLVAEPAQVITAPDGKQRVVVRALAYRSPDDPHPAVGQSWMELPGTTPYTRGSELENTETSAIGRAIGFLGILIDKSIASGNEVRSKADPGAAGTPPPAAPAPREGSLIGIAEAAKPPHDFEVRATPDGPSVGFALKEGGEHVRVIAYGDLAEQIASFREMVEGNRVTCFGTMTAESWTVKAGTKDERKLPYTRLLLSHLTGPDGFALPLVVEAESEPLFEPGELDAVLAKVP